MGSGTTFRVFFPCVAATKRAEAAEWTECERGSGTILVVDDEEIVLRMAQSVLDSAGYEVLTASNGREALEVYAAQAGRIDAVLLDMTMPVMGGAETMERLAERWPDATVITTSGYNLQEAERRFGARTAGFLQKPYTATQLMAKIAEVVKSRAGS